MKNASAAATKSRSRGVFAPAAFAFSTASQPRLSAAGGGGDQICVQFVRASPQYAIAQSGSACVTCVNAFAASRYQNECSSATARSNGFCTAGAQETGKRTCPIFSASSATTTDATSSAIPTPSPDTFRFM